LKKAVMKLAMNDQQTFKIVVTINVFWAVAWLFISQNLATYFFFIGLSVLSLWFIRKWPKEWLWIYIIILSISLIFVVFVYAGNTAQYGNPYYSGGSDDKTYEMRALKAMAENLFTPQAIQTHILSEYDVGSLYYAFLSVVAFLAKPLGGYSTWLGRTLNVFLLIYTLMLIHYLILLVEPLKRNVANIAVLVIAAMPIVQYVNSHVFRDTLNLFLVIFLAVLLTKIFYGKYTSDRATRFGVIFDYTMLLVSIVLLYYLRRNTLIYPIAIFSFITFDKYKPKIMFFTKKLYHEHKFKFSLLILSMIMILVLAVVLVVQSRFINFSYYVDFYTKYKQTQAVGGLSYFVFDTPLLPMGVILRSLYAFVSPFPSLYGSMIGIRSFGVETVMLTVSAGVGITFFMLPYIFKRICQFDWISLSFIVIFLSIIVTTFTFRHMIFYYPFMMILGVDGILNSSKSARKVYLIDSLIVGSILVVAYIALRFIAIGGII